MCCFYFSVLFFSSELYHIHARIKRMIKRIITLQFGPSDVRCANMKPLIIPSCNLRRRSSSTSSVLKLAKSRVGIFIYVKHQDKLCHPWETGHKQQCIL